MGPLKFQVVVLTRIRVTFQVEFLFASNCWGMYSKVIAIEDVRAWTWIHVS